MSRLTTYRDDSVEHRRRWGLRRTLYAAFMRALGRAFDLRLLVLHVRVHSEHPPATPLRKGREIRRLDRADLLRATADPRRDLSPEFVDEALARGDLCTGILEGDRLVSYSWRAFGPTPFTEDVSIDFGSPFRYGYKGLTLPEHRGEHLQDALAYATDQICLARGRTHGAAFVETHNFPSIHSNLRRENVVAGHALSLRLFGRRFVWNSSVARRTGVRLVHAKDVQSRHGSRAADLCA